MKTIWVNRHRWFLIGLCLAGLGGDAAVARADFTEELHKTLPLAADGRLTLDDVNGAVRIRVWDRPEVKIDALKRARKKEDLQALTIEIDAQPARLAVHTKYPESKKWFRRLNNSASVHFTLTVPRSIRLEKISDVNGSVDIADVQGEVKASTVNGTLAVQGLAAGADLSSVNGKVKVTVGSLAGVKSIRASTVNGSVELTLPANPNADLELSTLNGGIGGDIPAKKNWPVGREVKTRLGEGGTAIKISTVNGRVQVHLAKPRLLEDQ